jgi:hypothetical protein
VAFSVARPQAEREFLAVRSDPERHDEAVFADVDAVQDQRHQVQAVPRARIARLAAGAVFATKWRLTLLLLVPRVTTPGIEHAQARAHINSKLGSRIDQEFNQTEGPDGRSFNNERRAGCARLLHGGSFTERRVASVWSPLV